MRRAWSLFVVALLAGCFSAHEEALESAPARPDTANDEPAPPAPDPGPALDDEDEDDESFVTDPNCDRAGDKMDAFLGTYCLHCHVDAGDKDFLWWIGDLYSLVATGRVIPDDPDNSPLYQMIAAGTMPPATSAQPSEDDKLLVRKWVQCGAPPPEGDYWGGFTGIDDRIDEMLDDVRSEVSPEARKEVRYLDLAPIANAGASWERLEQYRAAVHELLGGAIREVGSNRLTLRMELRAAGFTPESWQALVADYPYDLRYDPDAELFPYDEEGAALLRSETGSDIPAVQADWFLVRMAATGSMAPVPEELQQRYDRDMNPVAVTSVLGITFEELQYALDLVAQPEPAIVTSLRNREAQISRATFEAAFGELVVAIQLGVSFSPEGAAAEPFTPEGEP